MTPGGGVQLLDLAPAADDFRAEALAGLRSSPRSLPCKFFYDERGSELFQQICELPEYYITRVEKEILRQHVRDIARAIGPSVQLVGFGTGAGMKTRLLLECLTDSVAYVPVDISKERLLQSAEELSRTMPHLEVLPVCTDYTQPFHLPTPTRAIQQVAIFFPGSTIGNFEPAAAAEFLRRIRASCDSLTIGVDLQKPRHILEAAYNDSAGVTAAFNLNLLVRANRELGANFNLAQWQHRAIYNEPEARIEMHLISAIEQVVSVGSDSFAFMPGEKIVTEHSYKHTVPGFAALAASAGFTHSRTWIDREQLFAVMHFT
jgi:dimethylhistidine N-methyltransferase